MAEDKNRATEQDRAAEGRHDLVGQPHSDEDGPVAAGDVTVWEQNEYFDLF